MLLPEHFALPDPAGMACTPARNVAVFSLLDNLGIAISLLQICTNLQKFMERNFKEIHNSLETY